MTFTAGTSGNPGANVKHGFYKKRTRHCDVCGKEFTAHRLTARYCSNDCRTDFGQWSYRVASQTNRRVLGTTGE